MLKRSLALGGALVLPGLACGTSSDEVSVDGQAQPDPTLGPVADGGAAVAPTQTPAVGSDDGSAAAQATTEQPAIEQVTLEPLDPAAAAGRPFPAGAEMVVQFTYTQGAGGKNLPPYIAVWVEDGEGELVETIELWFQQDEKGPRWLPDLKRWFRKEEGFVAAGGADETDVISSATRLAGSYSVVWDGQTPAGPLPAGDYFICIEAARERGPYSLIRAAMPVDGVGFELALPNDEELSGARVILSA